MTMDKDKRIASLKRSLAKVRAAKNEIMETYQMDLTEIDKLKETIAFQKKKLTECDQDIRNGEFREKTLRESHAHMEKERNELMLEAARAGRGIKPKTPEQLEKVALLVEKQYGMLRGVIYALAPTERNDGLQDLLTSNVNEVRSLCGG